MLKERLRQATGSAGAAMLTKALTFDSITLA